MASYSLSTRLETRQGDYLRNTNIYAAYAGVIPDVKILNTEIMWWDEEKIAATVDRQFVLSHLRPDEAERLQLQLEFGDGLTDHTYMEWIQEKAKRIFLILVDLGVPDQIFGVVDDSWDDDDLPLPLSQVDRLQLTFEKDEKLERKFYQRQFTYLLRNLQPGELLTYSDAEIVPIEQVDKRPVVGLANTNVDKVYLPNKPENVFLRRKIPLGTAPGQMPMEEFLAGIEQMRGVQHKHLVSVWASYIHRSNGYVLLTPISDGNLKGFFNITPPSIKILPKQERRAMFLNWLHCLADAVAFLHSQGLAHKRIKPSNVMMDVDNKIFLADCSAFTGKLSSSGKKAFDKESYDYGAPEYWNERIPSGPPRVQVYRASTSRAQSRPLTAQAPSIFSEESGHNSLSSGGSSPETESIYTQTPATVTSTSANPSRLDPSRLDPQKADIFSLGCIILDVLSALLKRPNRTFVSHRCAKNKTPGRGGGLPDSSFHKNLGQVESWILLLLKDGSKKEDRLFRGVSHILNLTTRMLSPDPRDRPDAGQVRDRLREIIVKICGIQEACCASSAHRAGEFGRAGSNLRIIEGKDVSRGQSPPMSPRHRKTQSSSGGDAKSVMTVRSNGSGMESSDGGMKSPDGIGNGNGLRRMQSGGRGGPMTKSKAWQAPVYAGKFCFLDS